MIEKNTFLTVCLTTFAMGVFLYRSWEVFLKRYGDRGEVSFRWTLLVLSIFHVLIGIFTIVEYFLIVGSYNVVIGLGSVLFFIIGQLLRNWAIKALGPFHSPHIEIKPGQQLVLSRPYSYLRHPYYVGVIFEVGSTPLIFNAYFTFLFYLAAYLPILLVRVFLEESVLKETFGSDFVAYKAAVSGFIPVRIKLKLK